MSKQNALFSTLVQLPDYQEIRVLKKCAKVLFASECYFLGRLTYSYIHIDAGCFILRYNYYFCLILMNIKQKLKGHLLETITQPNVSAAFS